MRPTGSPLPKPKEWHESHQRLGPTSSILRPCQNSRTVNASSVRESAWTRCTNNPTFPISTSNYVNTHSDSPTLTPGINYITPTIIETTSLYSSPETPTTATTTAFDFTTTISDGESLLSRPQCDRTFTSRIGLVGHLRIHRTETGEPVPHHRNHHRLHLHYHHPTISDGDCLLNHPLCDRTFTSRIGLVGHLRIHPKLTFHNLYETLLKETGNAKQTSQWKKRIISKVEALAGAAYVQRNTAKCFLL
ncbi:unnamed protein product [Schistocephalus solidus]|uniref:C2H2-type domain-containing protein n=1 Tax=Schistocephalus solidus TaxID=70667 RepID=A0A183S7I6_SCHSO|nr:unnamed protein product [Schistocephalus solidus]